MSSSPHGGPPESGSASPAGIRIQRRANAMEQPLGPPPSVPEDQSASQSNTLTRTAGTLSTLKRERARERERQQRELNILADLEKKEEQSRKQEKADAADSGKQRKSPTHPPLKERTSYVEEPHSNATTLERKERKMEKEQALVRRITNDMQIAHYVRQMEMARSHGKRHRGENTNLVQLGDLSASALRFVEADSRALCIWAKAWQTNKRYRVDQSFFKPRYTFKTDTRVARDTILRKDAVLAYSALKKRLDNFPIGNREVPSAISF
ncbi:hypothetical protein OSTOST_07794, partial [Ostertagia ostertagi]